MTRKITFRLKILLITFIVLVLIGSLGFVAYYKFSGIVVKVSEATQTDRSIALAKEILADLTMAENKVKSYTLTRDDAYVDEFDSIAYDIEEKIVFLYSGTSRSAATNNEMDTLIGLVSTKFEILSSLLTLQNEFRVQEAFDKIDKRLEKPLTIEESIVKEREKRKLNLFRKKEKEQVETKTSELEITALKKDLQSVSKQESEKEQQLLAQELELINADAAVTLTISALLKQFEDEELKRIEERATYVKDEVNRTKILIATVCVVTALFIFIMIYTIVNYLRSNNRYLRMIKKAKKESEQLSRAKERFIATISHEIRTPMNSIVGFTEQIAQGPLTKLQQAQIEIVRKASEHLLHLINEFLDFSKIQENKLTLNEAPFSPSSVIQEVVEISSSIANSKGISIHMQAMEGIDQIVTGDAFRLRQILLNIIGNAIKFTPQGSVHVSAVLENAGNERYVLKMNINDTGIGIEKNKLNSIFDVFEQESNSTSSEFGGSGLGLAITKRLVELHKGTIKIESQKKEGTKVEIVLPYKAGKYLELSESKLVELNLEDLKGLKVLVVDDEKYNRDLLNAILRKWLVEVSELEDGEQVAEFVQANPTDLVLMDMRMPLVSGIDATIAVRELEHSRSGVPIILLTAAVTDEERKVYMDSGVDLVLPKPFLEAQLKEGIFYVLGKGEFSAQNNELLFTEEVSFEALKQTCGDDHDFYQEMLSTLNKSIVDAQINLSIAFERLDYKVMPEIAHRVCAPVKHIRANRLYALFKQVEVICRSGDDLEDLASLIDEINKEGVLVCDKIKNELSTHV